MKKQIILAAIFSVLCVGAAWAEKTPVAPVKFTSEQWQQLKAMKPEQQKMAVMQGLHDCKLQEKMNALTPAQKEEVEKFIKDEDAHRKLMHERLQKMTKEQKEVIMMQHHPKIGKHFPHMFKGDHNKKCWGQKDFKNHKPMPKD